MTIKEVKETIKILHRRSVICYNKVPIKLPDILGYDGKEVSLEEMEKQNELIKDGYLVPRTQCLMLDDASLEENEIEISFCFCTYCKIKSDENIFDLWDFHKNELESLSGD